MPKYANFKNNDKVMDVLCCVILGYSRVSDMMKILNQPQSTISEKLRFLKKNKIVKKSKWVFEPNWKNIIVIAKEQVGKMLGKHYTNIFKEILIQKAFKTYAQFVIWKIIEPVSISKFVQLYFVMPFIIKAVAKEVDDNV
jgi:DNA-binding transcriptional ArsR family regulator